ncbi:hypothetical protein Y032_0342g3044 [Ancylostoma ceylanicum]|uniref:EGF-like domain-containing protein n=1 Tax=Ancylostoma ceylanicum TaxID=53326 RepID=A0A016RYT7_9BILA|nr:hypothetical protein Y032_0342g3044 [Ancylostoma ceylanicum]
MWRKNLETGPTVKRWGPAFKSEEMLGDRSNGVIRMRWVLKYGSRNYAQSVSSTSKSNEGQVEPGSHFDSRHQVQIQHQERSSAEIGQDMCAEDQHVCTLPNMRCRPVGPSYRCECLPGYQAKRDQSSALGWNCQDLNECERGDHTCDHYAVCHNTDGSFTCQCRPGYTGDGHHCSSA